jgi:PAS domain S-box-containing protein
MIYNDAYSAFAGGRHPGLLGSKVLEGWPEVADFNANVLRVVLSGGTLAFKDQELTLHRHGRPEQVWMNLDYAPVLDEADRPAGVIAVVVETTQRVLADRRVAAEQQRQRQLLHQMPGFIGVVSGPEHVYEYVNDAYVKISERTEFLGRRFRDVFADLADQSFAELLDQVYATGQPVVMRGMELRLHGSREAQYIDFLFEPVRDEAGTVTGVFIGGYEITESHRAVEALKASEGRLRLVVEGANDHAILTTDPAGLITGWSPGAEAIFGWSETELLGQSSSITFLPEDREAGVDMRELAEAAAEGCANNERWHVRKDGSRVFMNGSVYPLPSKDGAAQGFLKIARDETNRRRAEARRDALVRLTDALRDLDDGDEIGFAAAEILGVTLQVSRVGYGTIDPDRETLHVDRDWTAPGTGTLAGELRLRDYGTFVESLKRGELISIGDVRADPRTAPAAEALEGQHARSFINVPVVEKGRLVAVLYINHRDARAWSSDDLSFVREVAERTRTAVERLRSEAALRLSEARLREANETLEANVEARTQELMKVESALRQSQKMEAIGQLTGGIAHDFNNLLAAISGSLEMLEKRLSQGRMGGAERFIAAGQGAARRAASLTQRLLAFSRQQTLDPKPVNVNRLVAGMEDLIRRTVGPAVEVEVVGAGGLWSTKVDPSQLENALLNLCINARDAMPESGRITIETANKWLDDRSARERELEPGQYVSVCVTDTGIGMTPDVIAKAFDPFFTTKPIGQGTGLGLSMIHGFVRQSGGQVRIYSEPGSGTTMCLYLPRFFGGIAEDEAQEERVAVEPGQGETVLVVDDEAAIRMLIVEVLEEAGYLAVEAGDGPSAMKVLQSDARVDLLITDVGLPNGMNGRQVADAARVRRPDLKVLFITGYAENAAVGNGHLDPGMEVMTKPFVVAALGAKVREMIEG